MCIRDSSWFVRILDKKYNTIGIRKGNKIMKKKLEESLSISVDVNKINASISWKIKIIMDILPWKVFNSFLSSNTFEAITVLDSVNETHNIKNTKMLIS